MRKPMQAFLAATAVLAWMNAGSEEKAAAAPQGAALKGVVRFQGDPPRKKRVIMDTDPNCVAAHGDKPAAADQAVLVGAGGGIKNVFVHVKKGLPQKQWPLPKAPVKLDQKGCMYEPHVLGLQIGQKLEIGNADPLLHNVHVVAAKNAEVNKAQAAHAQDLAIEFKIPEVMVTIRCDLHPWMKAYVGVASHPFFAVTGEDGAFEIKDLPPGEYEIEAWHEILGKQSRTVKVEAGSVPALEFTFTAKEAIKE